MALRKVKFQSIIFQVITILFLTFITPFTFSQGIEFQITNKANKQTVENFEELPLASEQIISEYYNRFD